MEIYKSISADIQQDNSIAVQNRLWEKVQSIGSRSKLPRAGDDPEFARALAEFDRVFNPPKTASNVIPFRRRA